MHPSWGGSYSTQFRVEVLRPQGPGPGRAAGHHLGRGLDGGGLAAGVRVHGLDELVAHDLELVLLRLEAHVDDKVMEHGAYIVGFSDPTLKVETQATHGFVAVGEPMVVTKSDGYLIQELEATSATVNNQRTQSDVTAIE